MRHEWAIDISYNNGTNTRYNFCLKQKAEQFAKDMQKWVVSLGINTISKPIELHPQNAWYSPFIIDKVNAYLAEAE